jgi:hypothetical protein
VHQQVDMKNKTWVYRYQLHYDMYKSSLHPHKHMLELAKELGFEILKAEPVSIADCWIFLIESETPWLTKKFPDCITVQGYPSYKTDLIVGYTR